MRLSESIRRKVLDIGSGWVVNRFKIKKRRDTLFFEDILAEYLKICETAGHEDEIIEIGQEWMILFFRQLLPSNMKKIPPTLLLNSIMRKIWINLGLMDDFEIRVNKEIVNIVSKNEGVTRIVGKNSTMVGFYIGILNALYEKNSKLISSNQNKKNCKYTFKLLDEWSEIKGKDKEIYNRLNKLPETRGTNLRESIEKGILKVKDGNSIYFREKRICPTENTVFHLIGNKGIMMGMVPEISYKYFSEIFPNSSDPTRMFRTLRILLESMGWGVVKIVVGKRNKIIVNIDHPPYGLQTGEDNWKFLGNVILGYIQMIDKKYEIKSF
ncbi:MAG: hypothetical protein KAS04_06055, partial [Candidatus Aenigmarchaeota archaeon]|nr:hypothetical protein [Candidatus Aenigmarchaeota archaeon]